MIGLKQTIIFLLSITFLCFFFPSHGANTVLEEDFCNDFSNAYPAEQGDSIDYPIMFSRVESPAKFPYGNDSLLVFIYKNIEYPPVLKNSCVNGRLYVRFRIDTDGYACDYEVIRSPHDALSDEFIRVLKLIERWTPGKILNKPVECQYIMPLRICLE